MKSTLICTAALAALLAGPVLADDTPVSEVIVTRLPTEIDVITGARVIDRAEIEARQTTFATDLLATIPGVGITRSGVGGVAAIRIRGATADKTLVLIDGVPAGDAADPSGAFDASSLQLADIERVEILSGPQSSLWGSEAIGGVIAFTTRELDGVSAAIEGGSMKTVRGSFAAGVAKSDYALNASFSGFDTAGVSKAASGTERDGFTTWTATAGGRVDVGGIQFDGRVRYTDSDVDIDGFPAPTYALADTRERNASRAWTGFGRATADAFGLTHRLSVSLYDLKRDSFSDFPSVYRAERQVYRYTAQFKDALVVGAERTDIDADLDGRLKQDLSNTSVFAVGQLKPVDRLTLTGSVRLDDPDKYKSKLTGRVSAAYGLGAGFTLTGSAGTGFKTPTISQYVCDFCYAPPVALKPEHARGYDVRLGWRSEDGRFSAAVTGYHLRMKDQILYSGTGRYENVDRTRSKGIEAEALAGLAPGVRLKLAYALTDAENTITGVDLLRVPRHSGAAALLLDQGPWSGSLTVRGESAQDDRDTDGFSNVRRRGFVVGDVAAAYAISESLELTARVENVTDKRYQEVYGYGEPGRALYVGVRFRH